MGHEKTRLERRMNDAKCFVNLSFESPAVREHIWLWRLALQSRVPVISSEATFGTEIKTTPFSWGISAYKENESVRPFFGTDEKGKEYPRFSLIVGLDLHDLSDEDFDLLDQAVDSGIKESADGKSFVIGPPSATYERKTQKGKVLELAVMLGRTSIATDSIVVLGSTDLRACMRIEPNGTESFQLHKSERFDAPNDEHADTGQWIFGIINDMAFISATMLQEDAPKMLDHVWGLRWDGQSGGAGVGEDDEKHDYSPDSDDGDWVDDASGSDWDVRSGSDWDVRSGSDWDVSSGSDWDPASSGDDGGGLFGNDADRADDWLW